MDFYNNTLSFKKAVVYTLAPVTLPRPFYDSTCGPFNYVPMENWLELYDEDGVCGQAPCTYLMAKLILPIILNGEKKTYKEWYNTVYWKVRNNGFSSEAIIELGRLDLAMHDIMAKRAGLLLHRFWGATRDWVNVYASGAGTGLTIDEMEEEINGFLKDGYTVIKMKIGTNFGTEIDRDVKRVALVRKIIGKNIKLAIDANQLWNAEQALDFVKRVEGYDLEWYEEPVHSADLVELKKLTKVCPVPVAMGESMRNHYTYKPYVDCGVTHLQPVPSNMSGIVDWMKVRDLALENGLTFTSGGFSQITASYIATAAENTMVEYLSPINKSFIDLMKLAPKEKNGRFYLPSEPGLPVSPDWALIERKELLLKKDYYYAK